MIGKESLSLYFDITGIDEGYCMQGASCNFIVALFSIAASK
jgi:hypothetical protein